MITERDEAALREPLDSEEISPAKTVMPHDVDGTNQVIQTSHGQSAMDSLKNTDNKKDSNYKALNLDNLDSPMKNAKSHYSSFVDDGTLSPSNLDRIKDKDELEFLPEQEVRNKSKMGQFISRVSGSSHKKGHFIKDEPYADISDEEEKSPLQDDS